MATTLSLKDLVNQNSKTKTASNLDVNAQKTSSLKDVLTSNNQGQKTALERLQENKAFNDQYRQKNIKPTPTNTGNGVGYVAGKLGTGAFSILEGAWDYTAGGIASLFGADEWAEEQFANNISGRWNQELEENYNPNNTMKLVGDVSGGLGNSLLMFGVGAVATVLSGGAALPAIIAGGVTAGVGAAGQSTASAYEKTGELGLKEYGYGALSGATEGVLEGLTGAAGKQVAKVLAKNTAKSVVKKAVIKGVVSSGVGEAVEEGISELLDPYYLRATQVDPNAENATFQQIGYAGMVGGISGMLMGGVGETARAVKSNQIGNNIAQDQNKVDAVVNMAEKFANYENENATGKHAYQYINQLVTQYKSADNGSGKLTQKQKRLLGEMQQVNTALVFEPAVSKSKEKIIANAEAFVEYLNSKNIVDSTTGNTIHFDNVDAFIKNDYLVTQFAVADALGELMLSSDSVYDYITQKNTNGLTQDSFRNFQKNATLEQKMAVNKMLGGDVDSLAYEDVIKRIKETDATQIKNVEAGINALKASRKAMLTARNNNMVSAVFDGVKNVKDGTTLYQTKTGKEIAITKNGDKFYLVYNGKVSKGLTASKLGELIKAIDEEAKAKAEKKQSKQAEKQQETKKTEDSTEKKETLKKSENTTKKQETTDKKKPKVSDYFQKESKKEKMAREGYTPLEMKKAEAFARAKVKGYEDLSVGDKLEVEWTIASGWKLGASEADIISLANISAKAGIGVGFANLTAKTAKGKEVSVDAACYKNNDKLTIYINPKSNRSVEVATLHELTHALKGTKGYAELEAMAKEYYEKHPDEKEAIDSSYRQLYKKEIQKYEQEILPEELTAHYVEKMLEKRNVLTKLTEEQPSLMKRSIKWLKDRVNLLKNVDERATKEIQRLTNKFVSTFNLKTSMATANGKAIAYSYSSMQHTFFGDKEGITIKDFENRSYKKEQGYKDFKNKCLNNMRQAMGKNFKAIDAVKEVEKSIDGIVDVAVAMKKAGYDILDVKEKRTLKDSKDRLLFASLEPNSDYFTSSDISTICDKRVNFTEIYEDIVRKETQLGVPKGKRFFDNVDNYFAIHKIMADKGLTTPCEQCYVESMSKNLSPMAKAFITLMQEKDANNTKNDQLYQQSGKNNGKEKAKNAKLRSDLLEKIEQEQYDITVDKLNYDMLTTADGLAQLKVQAPFIYEAFNSFYGQSKPKLPKEATPYRFGELTALLTDDNGNIKKGLVDKIVSTGGFRFQSYSDFQIKNFADVLQVIFEAGTLGLNGHAYTKVPAFLDATKDTNLKRNISIFMYQDGKQWKIDRNDSFPYTLDKIYDIVKDDKQGNTGIIAVTQNEVMAAYVMANDNIAYFIPFHKSGMKMSVVRDTDVKVDGKVIKGYKNIKDHTRQQSEVWAKGENALKKVEKAINIYEFWDFENADNLSKNELIEKNVKEYINRCEEAGYLPKFREYVMNNDKVLNDVLAYSKELGFVGENATIDDISFEHKGYRIPYGYYKCLGDFGMFTPDGKASKIEKLSLKNYDFQKAVDFFADAESLRRTELLQQIANGEERQRYITGDKKHMTTDQIAKELQSKRDEVVADVLGESEKRFALTFDLKDVSSKGKYTEDTDAEVVLTDIEKQNDITNFLPDGLSEDFIKAIKYHGNFEYPRLYRGMEAAELDSIIENGYIKSNSSYNFSNQQGQTLFDKNIRTAYAYATSYAPSGIREKFYEQGMPAYIVEIGNYGDLNFKYNEVKESYTNKEIDKKYITRILELTYNQDENKVYARDISINGMNEAQNEAVFGKANFWKDKTTGTLLYEVEDNEGYANGLYISEYAPDLYIDYKKLENAPDYEIQYRTSMAKISGKLTDLEKVDISNNQQDVRYALDKNKKKRYNKKKVTSYIDRKLSTPTLSYIRNELNNLYDGVEDAIADGIGIVKGDIIYVVDSGKDNGKLDFGVIKKLKIVGDVSRQQRLESINDKARRNGYISRELLGRIGNTPDNSSGGGDGGLLGKELSANKAKSKNNQMGISTENESGRNARLKQSATKDNTKTRYALSGTTKEVSDRESSWRDVDKIQGLEDYSVEEVTDIVRQHIENIAMEYGEEISIIDIRPYGSRARGTAKKTSDLDVVVQYEGDSREDDMFNMLNDEDKLVIDGIEVDINPIKADDTGTIEEYLDRVYGFDKYNETKYSDRVTAQEDTEYMDAYYDGDDEKMQELVDKVANRLGYKYKAYHHTENAFTVFDLAKARKNMDIQGFYFSADKDAESEYGSAIYDTYLKMENPYVVDSKETQNAIPFDMSKPNAGVIAREWLQQQGYDSVIRKAEYFGAEADEYIVFDPSQIKSSEPMTYSDDENGEGDIIPLSERFNSRNDDIRYALKGSDKVMTELPSDEVTLKDVISGKANAKELVAQKKANTAEKTEATKILMTNAQAGVERVLKQGGKKDATAITNYVRAGKAAALNAIDIEGGQYNLTSDVRVGDTLGKIMKPIYDANKKDGKTYADFELYLLHWHNIDRMAQNKPVFHDENTPIEKQVNADDSREAIAELEKQYPQFKKIAKKVWKFNDNNLQLSVDSGMYSQEYADDMRLMYPHYVPTFRETHAKKAGALLGKNRIGINNMKKAAKGSEAKILPIDDMIAAQTIQKTTAARMNKLLVEMMENGNNNDFNVIEAEDADIDIDTETEVTFSDKDKNYQISFFYQGKKLTAQVSWAVYKGIEAFRPTSELSNNVAVAVTAKLNSWFKKGVTSLNPFFSFFKNPIRDMQDALLYTKYSSSDFLKNYNRARNEIQSNGKYWQEAKAAGITASSVYDYKNGIEYKETSKFKEAKEKTLGRIERASNAIEMSPRLAEYICAREAGLSVQEALLQAQDVTTNFGRGGTFAKTLNSTIMPFLNPSIQGFSKMVRAYMGEDGKKAWVSLIIRSLILGIGVSALNDILNDDEEYENLSDSVKENNYVLALGDGDFLKIPKGRVFSVFGSAFLRGRRYAEGDEKAWEGYVKSILSAVTPVDNITRTIFSPITDVQTNTTWYGGKIKGQKWDDTAPKDRYDESTSKISIWLGQVFDYSPIKINYLLEQYTGIVGDLVLPATSAQSSGSGSVNAVITQNMLANATTNSKWSGKFYDAIENYTYKKTAGDVQAKGVVKYLTSINKQVSEMYNDKRKVQANTTLSEKERLTQAKILQATINTLIQETLGNVDYLYNELGKYNLSNDDSEESTKAFNNAYRDCIRTIIGAEYALSTYNSDVYAKAKQLNTLGIGYETYYDYYFDTKGLTTERDENGNVTYTAKFKVLAYTKQQNLSALQKIILLMSKGYTVADGDIKGVSAKRAKKMVAQYITSLKVSREEKTELAKMLGFTVKNGKIYFN